MVIVASQAISSDKTPSAPPNPTNSKANGTEFLNEPFQTQDDFRRGRNPLDSVIPEQDSICAFADSVLPDSIDFSHVRYFEPPFPLQPFQASPAIRAVDNHPGCPNIAVIGIDSEPQVMAQRGQYLANQGFVVLTVAPGGNWRSVAEYFVEQVVPGILDATDVPPQRGPGLIPSVTELKVYPNPSNPGPTGFSFAIDTPKEVSLAIYNAQSQLVFTSEPSFFTAGQHTVSLPFLDLSSGSYFLQVDDARFRFVVIK